MQGRTPQLRARESYTDGVSSKHREGTLFLLSLQRRHGEICCIEADLRSFSGSLSRAVIGWRAKSLSAVIRATPVISSLRIIHGSACSRCYGPPSTAFIYKADPQFSVDAEQGAWQLQDLHTGR